MLSLLLIVLSPAAHAQDVTYNLEPADPVYVEICDNEQDDNENEDVDHNDIQCIILEELIDDACSPENPCDDEPEWIGIETYGGAGSDADEIAPPDHTFIERVKGLNTDIYVVSGGKLPADTLAFTHSASAAKLTQKRGLRYAFAAITLPDGEASTFVQAFDFGAGTQLTVHDLDNDVGFNVFTGQHVGGN